LDSTNVRSTDGGMPQRFSVGVYVEPSTLLAGWTLTPAARLDWTNDFASGFSLSLGVARTLLPALTLSVNASTAYRAPSFNDLYWPADSGAAGNPALKPESALAGDLGLRYAADKAAVSATLYARYTRDVILWQPGSDGIWRPSNYGAALYPGIEVEGSLKDEGPLSASLSYTLLHSYLLSGNYGITDDHRVPMVPEHAFELAFNYEKSPLKGRLSLAYKGLRYLGTANVAYDPAHLVVGAHLALETGSASALELDAENLLGERYESVQGYPMPGASLRVSWKLRLGASR
ncbi:MAG: TonB-dependent receptor, partial [Spirochaetota bacterium]